MPVDPGTPKDPPPPPTSPPPIGAVDYFQSWASSLATTDPWRPILEAVVGAMTSTSSGGST